MFTWLITSAHIIIYTFSILKTLFHTFEVAHIVMTLRRNVNAIIYRKNQRKPNELHDDSNLTAVRAMSSKLSSRLLICTYYIILYILTNLQSVRKWVITHISSVLFICTSTTQRNLDSIWEEILFSTKNKIIL